MPKRVWIVTLLREVAFAALMGYLLYYLCSCDNGAAVTDWSTSIKAVAVCATLLFIHIGLHSYIFSNARLFNKLKKRRFCAEYPANILSALNCQPCEVLPYYTAMRFVWLFQKLRGTLGTHLLAYYALGWDVSRLSKFYGVSEDREVQILYNAMGQLQSKRNLKRLWHSEIIQGGYDV